MKFTKIKKIIALGLAATAAVSAMSMTAFAQEDAVEADEEVSINLPQNNDDNSTIEPQWFFHKTYIVTGNNVNIRQYPNTVSAILGTLNYGAEIKVKEINNGWAKFQFDGGIDDYAYISSAYIKEKD